MTDYDAIERHAEKLADIAGDAAVGAKFARDAARAAVEWSTVDDLRASLDATSARLAADMAEDNSPYLWQMLAGWAAVADERFRVHGRRLWCRDDGTHPGWSMSFEGDRPSLATLVAFLRAHWACGEQS